MLVVDYDPGRDRAEGQYHVRLIDSESGDHGNDVKHQNQLGYWCDKAHLEAGILRPLAAALGRADVFFAEQFIITAGDHINLPVGPFPSEEAAHREYRRNQPKDWTYLSAPTIVRLLRPAKP